MREMADERFGEAECSERDDEPDPGGIDRGTTDLIRRQGPGSDRPEEEAEPTGEKCIHPEQRTRPGEREGEEAA
jgi:hypothetical protein